VRSEATSALTNYVDVLIGDCQAYTNIDDMVSATANEWTSFQLTQAQLPSAWTSAVPHIVRGGVNVRGLTFLAGMYSSHSNMMSFPCVLIDWE
jgi:hypothetical protein